jgi:hypothetical protein
MNMKQKRQHTKAHRRYRLRVAEGVPRHVADVALTAELEAGRHCPYVLPKEDDATH